MLTCPRNPATSCDGFSHCPINPLIARDRHHRAKQARGWQLIQPEPGTMVWITPSGRSYATGPTVYPV
jgi:hypothetical protein